ncbi:hypothetical protein SDC9_188404 [bioreactor metagenome]|uniref:Uncharacterized protein n=1 Tax=bioreactor metagenome TaxID=1076179 RepID=A0A645HXH0_9ZZZZ
MIEAFFGRIHFLRHLVPHIAFFSLQDIQLFNGCQVPRGSGLADDGGDVQNKVLVIEIYDLID